jgi:acyl-coenzyme A synthetase/AMP-(fatty) acid ligase
MAEIALSRAVSGTREILRDTLMGVGGWPIFEVPRVIRFETTLPREHSGKIIKRKLREPYWADTGRNI